MNLLSPFLKRGAANASLLVLAICPMANADETTPATAPEGIPAKMDQLLSATFRADAPGAAVLVVQHGNVVLRKGYGLADLELGVPMDAAQVLPICSITKQFTAVAILQLVQSGKLKLDDELSRFVPDYPTGEAKVTIEQLLAHTGGIPSIEEQPEARQKWREDLSPSQLLDYTRNKPLAFAPGTDWKYSNTGYFLLGRVIEKVSGQSYPDYIRTHLLAPAGMSHSDYPDGNRIIPKRARGFSRSGKNWINTPYFSATQAYSAGALLASVDDLWAWEQALKAGRVVDPELLQRAYTEGRLPDGRPTHYGLGWEITRIGQHSVIGHGGGMPGFAVFEARAEDAGVYVAVLCNTDAPPVSLQTLTARLIRLALGEPSDPPAAAIAMTPDALQEFVGSYRIGPDTNFAVTLKDHVLYGQLGRGIRPLKAIGEDEFTAGDDMQFHFVRDPARHVTKILVATGGPGPELLWARMEPSLNSTK